jgi:hypothetical protein
LHGTTSGNSRWKLIVIGAKLPAGRKAMGVTARSRVNWARMCGDTLEYIELHGSLRGFLVPRQGKQDLMNAAIEEGLIVWDKIIGKYDLTTTGSARLEEHRHKIATAT